MVWKVPVDYESLCTAGSADPYSMRAECPADNIHFPSKEKQGESLHANMKMLTSKGKTIMDDQKFGPCDFWVGYKFYCYARYSQCGRSRVRFLASKMGRVLFLLRNEKDVRWSSVSDERVREVWAMMEEYIEVCHGQNWKNLRSLMEEFDDVKELSKSEKGCLLLQLVDDDDYGTEDFLKHSTSVTVAGTNIFEELNRRLRDVGSKLDSLVESSSSSPTVDRNGRRKRLTTGRAMQISL